MTTADMAILISFGSFLISGLSLGWNIYRDVIRRPRLRVSIMVGVIAHPTFETYPHRVCLTITNFGPGKTRACMLELRRSSLWRKLFRRQIFAVLMPDYEDPLSGRLPADLEIGDKVNLSFRFLPDLFLEKEFNQIGIRDAFGQTHWCSKREYALARKSYKEQKEEAAKQPAVANKTHG